MACWYKEADMVGDIIISSRVRLARNLSDLPFPRRMNDDMFIQLKARVKKAIDEIAATGDLKLKFIEMNAVPENEINAMVERHVISPDFARNYHDRAIAISDDESVSVMIGEEDHIRIQVIYGGMALDKAYELADRLDTALNEKLGFAYDNQLGFLTECPTNIGTGLRASVMLHLPVCESSGQIAAVSDAAGKIGLTVRGMYGEGSKAGASLYQISNQITLGISEENAISNLKVIAEQIVDREKAARASLDIKELEDAVFRAYGTLKYARLLNSEEFMKLISMIKLGINMGIIEKNTIRPIELLIIAQPGMLQKSFSVMSPRERDEARAEMVRNMI